MARCYYCLNGCSLCKGKTEAQVSTIDYYGNKVPSPNGISQPVEVKLAPKPVEKITAKAARIAQLDKPAKKLYGYTSVSAREQNGPGSIYRTPDGGEVYIDWVDSDPNGSNTGWKDWVCIGEVTEWIRIAIHED